MEGSLIDIDDAPKVKPSERGWDKPTPLDYEALQAKPSDLLTKVAADDEAEIIDTTEQEIENPGWASSAIKYEWKDEYGDLGPEIPELERQLFTKEGSSQMGEFMSTLREFIVTQESDTQFRPISSFSDAGLHPVMVSNIKKCHFMYPTPIQAYCIPAVLHGKDVIAVAQTGSGKTAAYLIPALSKLMGKAKKLAAPRPDPTRYNPQVDAVRAEPLVLIICPTRELAIQIFDECRRLCYRSMLRPCLLYGGGPRREQLADLRLGCDILIGTPGRLKDIVTTEPRWLSLRRLKFTIIDEADEMLNADWEEELKEIISGAASQNDGDHVYMMFSATFPKQARQVAREYMSDDHVRIRVGRAGSAHANVLQNIVWVDDDMKKRALHDLLLSLPPCRTLIFVNNVHTVDVLDDYLYNVEFPVASIHSKRTQLERENAIRSFRKGTSPILIASAVTARGLDIKNVMHVINYDMPSMDHGGIDEYVHRIGRTARIGNKGQATSFFNDRDIPLGEAVCKILMESKQEVPDFLAQYAPEASAITWDDDTDDEGEAGVDLANPAESGGNAWAGGETKKSDTPGASNAWGPPVAAKKSEESSGGWGTPADAKKAEESSDGWGSGAGKAAETLGGWASDAAW